MREDSLLHVSRICIESRHNEADYRKIVHEYLESGQVAGKVSAPNVERVSKYRRDADRFRDDERQRETERDDQFVLCSTTSNFEGQRATNSRIMKRIES